MRKSMAFFGLTLVIAVFAAWSIVLPYRPHVLDADAPEEVFSATRAMAHVEEIAQYPHPVGSAEIRQVRRYLLEQLTALNLGVVEVQKTPYLARLNRRNYGVQVENLLVRLPGREPGSAMLFVAHYDSAPQGPGAADDASGVAALLEMLRALATGPQLKNDLIVLLSDAEEPGILGAQAFHDLHPWIQDVRVVVNLEARGYRGPQIMFETGPGSARWLGELRATGVPVIAASFTGALYARMSNETDFTVFKNSQIPGLNFAFIHDAVRYHTALDSADNLDRRSLQQQGELVLALAQRLGESDLEAPAGSDAVYFNLLGPLVIYSVGFGNILGFLVILAAVVILVQAIRSGCLGIGRMVLATVVLLVSMQAVAILFSAVAQVVSPGFNFALDSGLSTREMLQLGLTFLAVAAILGIYRLWRRWFEAAHLVAGGMLLWTLLAGLTLWGAVGVSYLFVLPLAASLPAAAMALRRSDSELGSEPDPEASKLPLPWFAALALSGVFTAILWAPTLNLIGLAIGPGDVIGFIVALVIFGLWVPILALADGRRSGWLLALIAVLASGVAFAQAQGSYSENNRRQVSLFYNLDQESGEAHWYSLRSLNSWTRQYLGESPDFLPLPKYMGLNATARRAKAPVAPLEGPEVWLRDVTVSGDLRTWQVELAWPPEVSWFQLFVEPRAKVRAITLGEQRRDIAVDLPLEIPTLTWFAPPEGLTIGIEVESAVPIELELVGLRGGLPEIPGFAAEPMPADMMMARFSYLHVSTSTRSVVKLAEEDVAPRIEDVNAVEATPEVTDEATPAAP